MIQSIRSSPFYKLLHPVYYAMKSTLELCRKCIYCSSLERKNRFKKLKNIKAGKRCFIIGNGPSLSLKDLNRLKGEDCFACNRIYGLYDQTEWRPKYYCAQDRKVLKQIKNDLESAIIDSEYCFLPYNYRSLYPQNVIEDPRTYLFYHPYVSVYTKDGCYREGIMPFSDAIETGIYDGLSITYAMMQIAVYMGYRNIYLLGIDHNYIIKNGVVDSSSYAEGIKPIDMSAQYKPELALCENAFRTARRFTEARGIRIYNATRGGKLEVFVRANLDQVLEGSNQHE